MGTNRNPSCVQERDVLIEHKCTGREFLANMVKWGGQVHLNTKFTNIVTSLHTIHV